MQKALETATSDLICLQHQSSYFTRRLSEPVGKSSPWLSPEACVPPTSAAEAVLASASLFLSRYPQVAVLAKPKLELWPQRSLGKDRHGEKQRVGVSIINSMQHTHLYDQHHMLWDSEALPSFTGIAF